MVLSTSCAQLFPSSAAKFLLSEQLSEVPKHHIESPNWKGPSKAIWSHSLHWTGTPTAPSVLRAPSSLTLAVCRDGTPTAFQGDQQGQTKPCKLKQSWLTARPVPSVPTWHGWRMFKFYWEHSKLLSLYLRCA